jgi:hypothetical protein
MSPRLQSQALKIKLGDFQWKLSGKVAGWQIGKLHQVLFFGPGVHELEVMLQLTG